MPRRCLLSDYAPRSSLTSSGYRGKTLRFRELSDSTTSMLATTGNRGRRHAKRRRGQLRWDLKDSAQRPADEGVPQLEEGRMAAKLPQPAFAKQSNSDVWPAVTLQRQGSPSIALLIPARNRDKAQC